MPGLLREVLGESQSVLELATIATSALALTSGIYLYASDQVSALPLWRQVVAFLLILDISAGCVANFTSSTNRFYATRPAARWVFIAIHVHILIVGWALGDSMLCAGAIWGYTIVGAALVTSMHGKAHQRVIAGAALAVGLAAIPLFASCGPVLSACGLLFMLKVLYSFAVDHEARDA